MPRFHFYKLTDGLLIGQTFQGPAAEVEANTPAGMGAAEGSFDQLAQRVDLAAVTARDAAITAAQAALDALPPGATTDERAAAQAALDAALALAVVVDYQPPAPSDTADLTWTWDALSRRWESAPTLGALKRAKWAQLKAQAQLSDQSNITIGGNAYAADLSTRALLFQQAQLAIIANATSVPWQLADETPVTLTLAQIKAGIAALGTRSDQIRAKALALRVTVMAATTPAAVEAFVWTWP